MSREGITKQIQPVLLKILESFVNICDKYNLKYYLIDGSLLGAVRHNGFIPWDDDIDVGMPRPDYEKFCEVAKTELPSNMYLVSYEDSLQEGSIAEIARMYCSDMQLKMDYFGNDQPSDAWMDIMIMYGMPCNSLKRTIHYKHYYLLKGLARMGRIEHIGGRKYSGMEKVLIDIARKIDLSKIINTKGLLLRCVKLLKKYPYDKADYVIVVPSEYGINEMVPINYYEPGRIVDFEGVRVKIPQNYDGILKQLYGDYMTPPPPEKRKSKHKVLIVNNKVD